MDRGGGGGGKIGVPSLPCEEGKKGGGEAAYVGERGTSLHVGWLSISVPSSEAIPLFASPVSLAAWICITCF